MFRIKKYNQIASVGLDNFNRSKYKVESEIADPDAIILRSFKLRDEPLAVSVKAIARAGAGVNNVPVGKCSLRGIVVFNTPGANANAVKELVFSAMLLCSRNVLQAVNYCRGLTDISKERMESTLEQGKKEFKGSEIAGKVLGVIGLGSIGAGVANMGIDLGMNVLGFDPAISVEAAWRLSGRVEKVEELQSLISRSDYISLHVPAIETTQNMINREILKNIKPGSCLLNFSRGEVINSNAVIDALENGNLHRFATDFPTPDMIIRDDVISMPHLGASTEEAEDNCAIMACNQLIDFLENGNIRNSVNFPTVNLERTTAHRFSFVNENVPGVLGNVLSLLANLNINVADMVNKSRGSIAYTIIDLGSSISDDLIYSISNIKHIITARKLGD